MTSDAGARRQFVVIVLLVSALLGGVVASVTPDAFDPSEADDRRRTASGGVDPAADLERVHAAGVTGTNVSVGVIDASGFDTGDPELVDRVVGRRTFGTGSSVSAIDRTDHGTAAASLVARTAPDADLYLASVDDGTAFRDAVTWLLREEVDVIVAPLSFYGKPGDGTAAVARAATLAAERDVVFVAPAGNLGRGHWQGRFRPIDGDEHRFGDGTQNYLLGNDRRSVTLWLSWEDRSARDEFSVELYRANGSDSRLVARSQRYREDDHPNARIVTRIDPQETYYFVVRGPANATGTRIRIASPTHEFRYRERARSIVAPGTAPGVVTVGAYDDRTGRVEPFSSAGPTTDGRLGVDVVAPNRLRAAGEPDGFVGSSAAAPYTAGVAALMLDANPHLEPSTVRTILRETAVDVSRPGTDPFAGRGRIEPGRAIDRARNASGTATDRRSNSYFTIEQRLIGRLPTRDS